MALAKLKIAPYKKEKSFEEFEVLFNPNTYSISKSVVWNGSPNKEINTPVLQIGGGDSRILSLELFYDVTEAVKGAVVSDVRTETNRMVALTRIKRNLQRPPVVQITWGDNSS